MARRTVTLVLTDGMTLAPFEVDTPWWQDVRGIVSGAREHHGLDVSVLRILHTEPDLHSGGRVSYLAEVDGVSPSIVDDDHPLRPDYAKPGGPARSIAWARSVLDRPIIGISQQRTWNLSAIWRLDTPSGPVWLKQVPGFFAHEARVLRYVGEPLLLAADDAGRMLLEDVPGEDLHDAPLPVRLEVASMMVRIQLRGLEALDRIPPMVSLPEQPWLASNLAQAAQGRLPDTLVHGDLHPGNVRGFGGRLTIIDWGDSFVGHPAFDILRLSEGLASEDEQKLAAHWAALWQEAIPGSDPLTTIEALRPVQALRNAATYANFLANIEPAEHRYHAHDVPYWLNQATLAAQRISAGE